MQPPHNCSYFLFTLILVRLIGAFASPSNHGGSNLNGLGQKGRFSISAGNNLNSNMSSGIWLDVWGDDMHHGYYPTPDFKDHKAAQVEMIERSLRWGFNHQFPNSFRGKKMVDVGCGVGGSSRYIVKKYGGSAEGISLSPFQVNKANQLSKQLNLSNSLHYQVADAMKMPFKANQFDLTWSMESGEHMPDKEKFVNELFRVTAPGGRIIILLNKISKAYYLPQWVPASKYVQLANQIGLKDVRQDDWSEFVAPFWPAVIRSALVPRNFIRMIQSGSVTFKGAIASLWMRQGLQKGVIKFALISGRK